MLIRPASLKRGIRLYEQAVRYWGGFKLGEIPKGTQYSGREDTSGLPSEAIAKKAEWVDLAGMLLTRGVLDAALKGIHTGELPSFHEIDEAFRRADAESAVWSVPSCHLLQTRIWGCPLRRFPDILRAIEVWICDSEELFQTVLEDGMKEFSPLMQLTSGIDTINREEAKADFENAGGRLESHPFLERIRDRIKHVQAEATSLLKKYKTGNE